MGVPLLGLSVAAATVLALSGCGTTSPSVPQIPVADQLDVTAHAAHPCDLLRADRATRLELVPPGAVVTTPAGPACRWASTGPGAPSFTAGVDVAHGLADLYGQRADHPYFQPGTVAGYPAVDIGDGPPAGSGRCTTETGTTDHTLVDVEVDPGPAAPVNRPDPCLAAHRVAEVIIGQVSAGNP